MGTLAWAKDHSTKDSKEAIKILYETNKYHNVIVYNSDSQKLSRTIQEIYQEIKMKNSKIPDIRQQMLPTYPYRWDDIDGCLHVECAEISIDTFENNAGKLALFSGWNYSVLSNPEERKPLESKAMASLSLLGYLANH